MRAPCPCGKPEKLDKLRHFCTTSRSSYPIHRSPPSSKVNARNTKAEKCDSQEFGAWQYATPLLVHPKGTRKSVIATE